MSERYERAAAVSVFRGNMRRGIMTLSDGAHLARQQGNLERCTQDLTHECVCLITFHLWFFGGSRLDCILLQIA